MFKLISITYDSDGQITSITEKDRGPYPDYLRQGFFARNNEFLIAKQTTKTTLFEYNEAGQIIAIHETKNSNFSRQSFFARNYDLQRNTEINQNVFEETQDRPPRQHAFSQSDEAD